MSNTDWKSAFYHDLLYLWKDDIPPIYMRNVIQECIDKGHLANLAPLEYDSDLLKDKSKIIIQKICSDIEKGNTVLYQTYIESMFNNKCVEENTLKSFLRRWHMIQIQNPDSYNPEKSNKATPSFPYLQNIFVVHGHDQPRLNEVELFLRKIGTNPIIIKDMPSNSSTIIEKLESSGNTAHYAVVLWTPCNMVRAKSQPYSKEAPYPRTNVIGETFWFFARLGRNKVSILCTDDSAFPSDLIGIQYIPMKSDGKWRIDLAKDLYNAGISITTTGL